MDYVIQFEGTVYEQGYGLIAQKVMRDKDIPPISKSIYAYLCSFAGMGKDGERTAFPGVSLMMAELGIKTDDTYYKYRKPLIQKGYIKIEKRRQEGAKFDNNIYKIVAVPVEVKEEIKPTPKLSGMEEPYPNLSCTAEPCTVKSGTNITSSIITSSINLKEEEEEESHRVVVSFFEKNIATSNGAIEQAFKEYLKVLPLNVIMNEIDFVAKKNANTFSYLEKVLEQDLALQIDSIDKLEQKRKEHANKKGNDTRSNRVKKDEKVPSWLVNQKEQRKSNQIKQDEITPEYALKRQALLESLGVAAN